jgi:hypothetical protein
VLCNFFALTPALVAGLAALTQQDGNVILPFERLRMKEIGESL